jgi:AmmeMemoRadiSam system protein B
MATKRSMSRQNFYAGDCAKQVKEFLVGIESPDEPADLVAGVVPHAGWVYSGKVAARVWRTLAERAKPETVIIFGAVHLGGLHQNAVYGEGSWETPIGDVEVDSALAREILAELKHLVTDDPSAHDGEHSIEVHIPMVKAILPKAKIVPIAVPPSCNPVHLGDLLGHLVRDRRVTAVGSTDLTHYGEEHFAFAPRGTGPAAHEWMKANDRRVLDLVENLLAEEIIPEVASHHNACGPGALAAVTAFAKARGAERGIVLEQTTSYEVLPEGTFTTGVGYAGVVF